MKDQLIDAVINPMSLRQVRKAFNTLKGDVANKRSKLLKAVNEGSEVAANHLLNVMKTKISDKNHIVTAALVNSGVVGEGRTVSADELSYETVTSNGKTKKKAIPKDRNFFLKSGEPKLHIEPGKKVRLSITFCMIYANTIEKHHDGGFAGETIEMQGHVLAEVLGRSVGKFLKEAV